MSRHTMPAPLDNITDRIRERISEIDAQLAGVDELTAERDQLRQALAALGQADRPAPPKRSARRTGTRRNRASRPTKPAASRAKRSRPGANRERIVAHLRESGPAPASAIAKATGINRAVVYSNLAQLTEAGEVTQQDDAGTAHFALTP